MNIWQSYKQERDCLMHFVRLANVLLKDARNNHVLACNFAKYSKKIPHTFLIWLLTTPPHLKYVATLPCNLSLMACFSYINVSQGSNICKVRWDL